MSVSILLFTFAFRWRKSWTSQILKELSGCFQYLHVYNPKQGGGEGDISKFKVP